MPRDLTVSTLHPRKSVAKYTRPFQKLPRWEYKFWPCFMMIGYISVPLYILYYLPDYRGGVGPHVLYLKRQQQEAEKNQDN